MTVKMSKIIVTGAAGFIGSCLAGKLNNKGLKDIILVDDFNRVEKERNHAQKACLDRIDRDRFHDLGMWLILSAIVVLVIPLGVLGAGLGVWLRRRHL